MRLKRMSGGCNESCRPAGVLCVLLALLLFSGCGEPDKPDGLIPETQYSDLLMEVFITQNLIHFKELTEKRDSVMTDLFTRYGVTGEQFERSHKYYQVRADEQKQRIDRIREKLREERLKVDQARQEQRDTDRQLRTQEPESSDRRP